MKTVIIAMALFLGTFTWANTLPPCPEYGKPVGQNTLPPVFD